MKQIEISKLKKASWNYKNDSESRMENLVANIKRNGQIENLIVREIGNDKFEIVNGNHRYDALIELKTKKAWCYNLGKIKLPLAKRIAIETNETRFDSDPLKMNELMRDLEGKFGLDDLKMTMTFDDKFFSQINEPLDTDGDDDIPKKIKTVTKMGDLWELGTHRVLCADSTKESDVSILMDNKKANLFFTDPPYSVNYSKKAKEVCGRKDYAEIKNDNMSVDEISKKIWKPVFKNVYDVCKDDASFYMTMPQGGDQMMMMMMMSENWQVKHELIWVKDIPVFSMNRLDYDYQHEPIAYGWKKKHNFYRKGAYPKSVWQIPKPRKSKLHPTMKPIELIQNAIENSTLKNNIVIDTFLGSGSTLIACEKTNRTCYGIELDKHYCDVIRDRYINFCIKNDIPYTVSLNGKPWKSKKIRKKVT